MWKHISWTSHALRLVWTFSVGVLLGWASGSILLGGGLAGISQKLVFGDWDAGYAWTYIDILFWTTAFLQGAAGAALSQYLGIRGYILDSSRVTLGTRLQASREELAQLELAGGMKETHFDSMT